MNTVIAAIASEPALREIIDKVKIKEEELMMIAKSMLTKLANFFKNSGRNMDWELSIA
jgi:hypothetical protein